VLPQAASPPAIMKTEIVRRNMDMQSSKDTTLTCTAKSQ
jgi:hypothetical protein